MFEEDIKTGEVWERTDDTGREFTHYVIKDFGSYAATLKLFDGESGGRPGEITINAKGLRNANSGYVQMVKTDSLTEFVRKLSEEERKKVEEAVRGRIFGDTAGEGDEEAGGKTDEEYWSLVQELAAAKKQIEGWEEAAGKSNAELEKALNKLDETNTELAELKEKNQKTEARNGELEAELETKKSEWMRLWEQNREMVSRLENIQKNGTEDEAAKKSEQDELAEKCKVLQQKLDKMRELYVNLLDQYVGEQNE